MLSTEDFLNGLGVNTHLNGLTAADPWNTNTSQVAEQLRYIGVRLVRDWAYSVADGERWAAVQKAWGPYGRFWSSIDEASPANQRKALQCQETIWSTHPGLLYAMGGPNEEDNEYPRSRGATLPDSVLVQQALYTWAHADGRQIPVSQMEFGSGWTAANQWQGDYNPRNTGIGQNYTPGPADLGAAHTYLSNPNQRPVVVLDQLRALARLVTPDKPVAHTEVGAYAPAGLSAETFGEYMVMGAFDSAAAGDAAYIIYGLQDSGPEATYGFYTYPGGKPHAVAEYFHTLTQLLASRKGAYGPGSAPTFRVRPVDASFSNTSTGHLLLQKPTGETVIADWSEQLANGQEHDVTDTIRFGAVFRTAAVYDVEAGTTPITTRHDASEITLTLRPNHAYLLILSGHSQRVGGA
jgi:hypothetical protein